LEALKEVDAAAVAVGLRVVEAVNESWAVCVAVSVGFTVDVYESVEVVVEEAVIGLDTQFVAVFVGAFVLEPVKVLAIVLVVRGLPVIVRVPMTGVLV
jgi:hypothetical protein